MSTPSRRKIWLLFYLSTLMSSIGSMTFAVCLLVFVLKSGLPFWIAGSIMGANRLIPLLVNLSLGDLGDRIPANRILIVTEVIAAVLTVIMISLWRLGEPSLFAFICVTMLRSSVVSLQQAARSKVSKLLAADSYQSNSRNAIWLNKTTQGATIFAGLIAWFAITHLDFVWVMIFDSATFVFGGILMWFVPTPTISGDRPANHNVFRKFRVLYRTSAKAATLDLLLALTAAGGTTFTARLAGDHLEWTALLMSAYGVSIWATGFLERLRFVQNLNLTLWLGLGLSLTALGFTAGSGVLTWVLLFQRDIFFWALFHRISAHIQNNADSSDMAAASAARTVQMTAIIGGGEFLVGAWQKSVPIWLDGSVRGLICMGVIVTLILLNNNAGARADDSPDRHARL